MPTKKGIAGSFGHCMEYCVASKIMRSILLFKFSETYC